MTIYQWQCVKTAYNDENYFFTGPNIFLILFSINVAGPAQ